MTRTEISIAIGTTFLSFIGALLGVYVGSQLDQGNWEKRAHFEQQKTFVDRRVAIMERTSVSFSKAPIMAGLRMSAKLDEVSASLNVACARLSLKGGQNSRACKYSTPIGTSHIEATAKEAFTLNAEFSSTLVVAAIYFGPETRSAIKALEPDPWIAGSEKYQRLMDAMGREIFYFQK